MGTARVRCGYERDDYRTCSCAVGVDRIADDLHRRVRERRKGDRATVEWYAPAHSATWHVPFADRRYAIRHLDYPSWWYSVRVLGLPVLRAGESASSAANWTSCRQL